MPFRSFIIATTAIAASGQASKDVAPGGEKVIKDRAQVGKRQGGAVIADDTPIISSVANPQVRHIAPPPQAPVPTPPLPVATLPAILPATVPLIPTPPALVMSAGGTTESIATAFTATTPIFRSTASISDCQPDAKEVKHIPTIDPAALVEAPLPQTFIDTNLPVTVATPDGPTVEHALVVTGANAASAILSAAPPTQVNFTKPTGNILDTIPDTKEVRQELRMTAAQEARSLGPRRI